MKEEVGALAHDAVEQSERLEARVHSGAPCEPELSSCEVSRGYPQVGCPSGPFRGSLKSPNTRPLAKGDPDEHPRQCPTYGARSRGGRAARDSTRRIRA